MARVRQIVGLDIGAHTVRAAWVQVRGSQPRVVRTEQMVLPLETPDPGRLVAPWLERLGLTRGFCAIGLSGGQTVFQSGRLAPEDPRTPQQAAAMELATFSDMAGDSMQCSVAAFEWRPGTRLYLMAMARPVAIERALSSLIPLGVRAADLVPGPVAVFNALERLAGTHDAPYLYINMGHVQTELAIGSSGGLLFARSIPIGGKAFTDAVAQAAGITPQQAEVQKHREASLLPGAPMADALRPAAERWLSQLSSCLSVYRSTFTGDAFALGQAVLSGGGAQLRGLAELVRTRLNLPVVSAEALPEAERETAPGTYDVAIGLAITAHELGTTHVSLLPPRLRDEIVFREKKPYWIAAGCLGALTLGIFSVSVVRLVNREARRLDDERTRLRKHDQINQGIVQLRQRNAAIRARAEPLWRILEAGPRMRLALTLAANTIAAPDWISMVCEESTYLPTSSSDSRKPAAAPDARPLFFLPGFRGGLKAAPHAEAARTAGGGTLRASDFNVFIIEGYTPDVSLKSAREMIQGLRTAPEVLKVDLLSDDRVLPPTLPEVPAGIQLDVPDMRRFVLRLELKRP